MTGIIEGAGEVQALFSKEPLYVWVLEFQLSHCFMRVLVHPGEALRAVELICDACSYFSGPMQSGPQTLRLEKTQDGLLEIIGGERDLVIRCASVKIGHRRRLA